MTTKLVALVLLCLMTGTAVAQEPKVTSLMSKDLPENPGREALMFTVEHAPSGSSAIHRHNAHAFVYVLEGSVVMQLKGGQQVTLTPGQHDASATRRCHCTPESVISERESSDR
jgi:quercetin dioxygenase-like cupin family protein